MSTLEMRKLQACRRAQLAADLAGEVEAEIIEDRAETWEVEVHPRSLRILGGSARVRIAKADLRVLEIRRCQ